MVMLSCSIYKNVPETDKFFEGRKIVLPDSMKNKKEVRESMEVLMRPKANRSILGVKLRLMVYNAIAEPKKQKGLVYDFKHKYGEAPVLLSQTNIPGGEKRLSDYLFSIGYLKATVKGETKINGQSAQNIYTASPGKQYTIRNIILPSDTGALTSEILAANNETLLAQGQPFNLKVFKDERERIDRALKEKGYFFFTPDAIIFRIDTLHNGELDVYAQIKAEASPKALEVWRIGTISIYGNYTLERDSIITRQPGKRSEQYTIIDKKETYKTELYDRVVVMDEGQIYNRESHDLTIERLMNLNTFRFVKTAFIPDTANGENKLNTRIYITPSRKQTLKMEITGDSKSNNFIGSEIAVNYKNINVGKGAEILEAKLSAGFDKQIGGAQQNSNAITFKAELNYYIPKLVPNIKIKTFHNSYIPRTVISPAIEFINRQDLYTLRSVKLGAGYIWKHKQTTEHNLRIININSIDPSNITPKFDSILAQDVTLRASFEKQLVIGSRYSFNYNNTYRSNSKFNYAFEGRLATSGNLPSLLVKSSVDTPGAKQIFSVPISQFIRAQADFRTYVRFNPKTMWVSRIIAGGIFAYGNSKTAPYSEQFFIGGSSSIRAFRTRTLGPGSYHTAEKEYEANESGELKLEMNTEIRYNITKIFRMAAFVDAGNIWLRKDASDKPGSGLSKGDLWKEMAIGAGLGIRIDASVLVIRFDYAIPFRKPWYPEGNRWVLDEINFGNKNWRKENLILNIGIGYPF